MVAARKSKEELETHRSVLFKLMIHIHQQMIPVKTTV
jgi:hypothetical protein